MSEFDFDPAAPIGFESFDDSATKQVGLESLKVHIRRVGMNQTAYYAGEAIEPGLFSKLSVKALTKNPSKTKQSIAMEVITEKQMALGGAVAVATGGLGYMLYRFWKWIKSKFSSGELSDADISNNELKIPTADEALAKGEKIAKKVASDEELAESLKPYASYIGKPEYVAIAMGIHGAKKAGLSKNELETLLKKLSTSKLVKDKPEHAIPLILTRHGIVPIYKIAKYGKFNRDFVRQLTHYADDLAKQVILLTSTDGSTKDINELKNAVKRLDSAFGASPNIRDAVSAFDSTTELGKLLASIRSQRIGYFTSKQGVTMLDPDAEASYFDLVATSRLFEDTASDTKEFNRVIEKINDKLKRDSIKESEISRFNSLPAENRKDLNEISKKIQEHTGNVLRAKKFFQYCYRQVGLYKQQVNEVV